MYRPDYEITYWHVGGITISEPVTALTDLLISAVAFYVFFKLKNFSANNWTQIYIRYYFLFLGIATLYGGIIGHAFLHYLGFNWKAPAWIISMISVALAERAAIMHARDYMKPQIGQFFSILNWIELTTLLFLTLYFMNFFLVEVHAAYGLLLVVGSFEAVVYIKAKQPSSKYILTAIAIGVVTATIHISKFTLHPYFNHLDLSHITMCISLYVFYLGAKRIPEESKSRELHV